MEAARTKNLKVDWIGLERKLVLLAVLITWQRDDKDMGVDAAEEDGGRRSQDTQAGTQGGGRDTCGLLQGHTGWLPECHTPTYWLEFPQLLVWSGTATILYQQ